MAKSQLYVFFSSLKKNKCYTYKNRVNEPGFIYLLEKSQTLNPKDFSLFYTPHDFSGNQGNLQNFFPSFLSH